MATDLKNTTVLVTGGAGGLGKVIAKAYLQAGAKVAICDINTTRLDETRAEFSSIAESESRVLAVQSDITDESAVESLMTQVTSHFGGRLDILINNAGMADKFHPVGTLTKETWDRVLGLNLTGSFLAMKHAVHAMSGKGGSGSGAPGIIIQIGSTASNRGFEAGVAYTVSKHGVAALVKHTAGAYSEASGDGERPPIYAIGLMLGAMPTTNIGEGMQSIPGDWDGLSFSKSDGFRATTDPQGFMATAAIDTADVAKYCLFLSDPSIACGANGSCITFNRNSPRA